jgi:hypothetical protein
VDSFKDEVNLVYHGYWAFGNNIPFCGFRYIERIQSMLDASTMPSTGIATEP